MKLNALSVNASKNRQATNNPLHANATAAVPSHFNQPGHSIADIELIPLELQATLSMSRRKARGAYLTNKYNIYLSGFDEKYLQKFQERFNNLTLEVNKNQLEVTS